MKREKEELKDRAPIIETEGGSPMVDPAPVIIIDAPKPKSEEGLSGKDIEVIEDALEKLGKFTLAVFHFLSLCTEVQVRVVAFIITYSSRFVICINRTSDMCSKRV